MKRHWAILNRAFWLSGGRIFFAHIDDQCVGCCALLRTGADEYEVAKMAVTPACQGMRDWTQVAARR